MVVDKKLLYTGLLLSVLFVVIGCVWLAESNETFDVVAEEFGAEEASIWSAPLPDYEVPGLEGNVAVNIIIGVAFTLLTLAAAWGVGAVLRKRS